MSLIQLSAWLSLALSAAAAALVTRRTVGSGSRVLATLCGSLVFMTLLVVPVHLEAALEILGAVDRVRLLGPVVVSGALLVAFAVRGGPFRDAERPGEGGVAGPAERQGADLPRDLAVAATVVALVYGFFALERALGYPTTWDSVAYHLPVAVSWMKAGTLAIGPESHFYEAATWNGDVLVLVAVATGWVALAELWNVVPALVALTGTYLLAREIDVGREGALLAVIMVASLPMVLHLTFSAYVDLLVAGCLVGCLALGVLFFRGDPDLRGSTGLLVCAGLAAGLAVGTKPTAWPLAGVLVLAVGYGLWRWPVAAGRRPRLLGLFAVAVAAPCAFWLVRNAAATGNPAFPMQISLFGHEIFAGTAAREISFDSSFLTLDGYLEHWITLPWTEGRAGAGYPYATDRGFGPLFAAFVLPGLLYLAWRLRRWRELSREGGGAWGLRAALVGLFLFAWGTWWFLVTPVWRYGLTNLLLACLLAAPFVEAFRRALPRLFRLVLLTAVVTFSVIAATPRAQSLAHQVRRGEWSWEEYYHLPAAYTRIPTDATVVNRDVNRDGYRNFPLLGPELARTVVPHWEARRLLERDGGEPWSCGAYVVDRFPFDLEVDGTGDGETRFRLIADTVAPHGPERWRIWRVVGREACGRPAPRRSDRAGVRP